MINDLQTFETHVLPQLTATYETILAEQTLNARLQESMRYSLAAGGKRIRPLLLLATVQTFKRELTDNDYRVALALEMIHTYSLIHDDLPAMDDDDLRRGKPTNHKQFDEATAILAGDALLTLAFEVIGKTTYTDALKVQLMTALAQVAGANGMVGGQASDMQAEGQSIDLATLQKIHRGKTGQLLRYAFVAGGLISEQSPETVAQLAALAEHLGLAFQIRDDILDVVGTPEELGKATQKDQLVEKSTYPKLLGLTGAKLALAEELDAAKTLRQQVWQTKEARLIDELIDRLALVEKEA